MLSDECRKLMSCRQLLDEVKVLTRSVPDISPHTPFPSSLLSVDNKAFEKFLKGRAEQIAGSISHMLVTPSSPTGAPSPTPPASQISDPQVIEYVKGLQSQYAKAIASDRLHINEVEQERLENSRLQEQVENATMRYMVAEKKLDRSKSSTVQKLERQAIQGGRSETGSGLGGGTDSSGKQSLVNGQVDNSENYMEMERAVQETLAASAKLQEQLDQLTTENAMLNDQNTELIQKASQYTDDDYAHTNLFKHLKTVHEDHIKRLNDLEATNVQLRKEAENSQSQRASDRMQLETETQAIVSEKEIQLTQAESDLARVRTARDELSADLQMKKAALEQVNTSEKYMKGLLEAREKRISALESEIDRLRISLGEREAFKDSSSELAGLSHVEICSKYSAKVEQYDMLTKETSSMGVAYQKAAKIASAKIEELRGLEDKAQRFSAEKNKADQKYFGAMKAKEAQSQEVRTLRAQNNRSSNVMAQLKEADKASAATVASMEKQTKELTSALQKITKMSNEAQQKLTQNTIISDGMKTQIDNLKQALSTKDATQQQLASKSRRTEVEVEELRARVETYKKDISRLKASTAGRSNEEDETYRVSSFLPQKKTYFLP